MAHSKANMITRTYSGKFGDLCLQRDGVIRSRPNVSKRILSERQTSHLNRFEAAKAYGRQVMADEAKSAFYGQYLKRWKKKKEQHRDIPTGHHGPHAPAFGQQDKTG